MANAFDLFGVMFSGGMLFMVLTFILWMVMAFFIVVGIAFWIWIMLDCIRRDFPDQNHKLIWVLVVWFGGFVGAVIYYFMVKRRG